MNRSFFFNFNGLPHHSLRGMGLSFVLFFAGCSVESDEELSRTNSIDVYNSLANMARTIIGSPTEAGSIQPQMLGSAIPKGDNQVLAEGKKKKTDHRFQLKTALGNIALLDLQYQLISHYSATLNGKGHYVNSFRLVPTKMEVLKLPLLLQPKLRFSSMSTPAYIVSGSSEDPEVGFEVAFQLEYENSLGNIAEHWDCQVKGGTGHQCEDVSVATTKHPMEGRWRLANLRENDSEDFQVENGRIDVSGAGTLTVLLDLKHRQRDCSEKRTVNYRVSGIDGVGEGTMDLSLVRAISEIRCGNRTKSIDVTSDLSERWQGGFTFNSANQFEFANYQLERDLGPIAAAYLPQ